MNIYKVFSICITILCIVSSCSQPKKKFNLGIVSDELVTRGYSIQEMRSFPPEQSSSGLSSYSGYSLTIKRNGLIYEATVHSNGKINIYPDDEKLKEILLLGYFE